ncbi:hypothetical protein FE392_11950 [Xenorhabdus sp. 12]|uniref:Uncharacterized protein n=1 Tax=Xenorhabdus santafensis TaxID=2582833 RepID=A0ABU4SB59_9GAMM|nr:hypothetical protein [Xenorhabdus sp. 12]MDX7988037.1 hypothetical protein [Xenorhabdus sp. 12]
MTENNKQWITKIYSFNGLGNDNTVLVSSQISFDFDWSDGVVNGFLEQVINTALSEAHEHSNGSSVTSISIVRIYNLS